MTDSTTTVVPGTGPEEKEFARGLMERAKADGVSLVGPGGLLTGLAKTVIETALEAELSEELGYEPHGGPEQRQFAERDAVEDGVD